MKTDAQEFKEKKKSFKRFLKSFKFAYDGIRYAFYNEQNIIVMLVMGIIAMIVGLVLHISYMERLIIVLMIGVILSLEMINTAIEAVTNLASEGKINKQAKVAKDCASAALAIMCIFSVIVGCMIFIPKIIELF